MARWGAPSGGRGSIALPRRTCDERGWKTLSNENGMFSTLSPTWRVSLSALSSVQSSAVSTSVATVVGGSDG